MNEKHRVMMFLVCLLAIPALGLEGAKKNGPDCKCLDPGHGEKTGVVADKKADLVAVASLTSSQPSGTVSGTAYFYQRLISGLGLQATTIKIDLQGLAHTDGVTEKGWHIHQFGNLSAQTDGKCLSVGGHYNPDNVDHGDPNGEVYHRGDLGNLQIQPDGTATFAGVFPAAELIGLHSVIGRALTIHLARDDLGTGQGTSLTNGNSGARIACGVIGWAAGSKVREAYNLLQGKSHKHFEFKEELSAIAVIQPATPQGSVVGVVLLTQAKGKIGQTQLKISLSGLPTAAQDYQVGWHIHELADLTPTQSANGICGSTGAHYNPKNNTHGGPQVQEKHKGDLGNLAVKADGTSVSSIKLDYVDLNGIYSVIGRSIVIHAKQDDLGTGDGESQINGNSGPRIACGVIGWATEPGEALRLA